MKRNCANLRKWKECIKAVFKRAGGCCEVMIDGKRCGIHYHLDSVGYINFAHKKSRNLLTDEQTVDPDYVVFSCTEHHVAEHTDGDEIESVEYEDGELTYVPDEQ